MVKSKKLNKSTVAVIVLALLLVLSLVLSATGAWFTDKSESEDVTLDFGAIKFTATSKSGVYRADQVSQGALIDGAETNTDARLTDMPGDYFVFDISLAKGEVGEGENKKTSEDFYWAIIIDSSKLVNLPDAAKNAITAIGGVAYDSADSMEKQVFVELDGDNVYGNEYQAKSYSFTFEIRAIQKANISKEDAQKYLTNATGYELNWNTNTGLKVN